MNPTVTKIVVAILLAMTVILWNRFFTWGFVESWHKAEIKLPLIPLLAALAVFIWFFFDKSELFDFVRLNLDAFVKRSGMSLVLVSIGLLCGTVLTYAFATPPTWKRFIDNELIAGNDDQFYRAGISVAEMKMKSADLGMVAEIVVRLEELSEEESKWGKVGSIQDELHIHQKRIESLGDNSIFIRALKNHALGNLALIALDRKTIPPDEGRALAISAFSNLLKLPQRASTSKQRLMARKALGNAFHHSGKHEEAILAWEALPEDPNTMANLVVGYRLVGELQKSVECGLSGLALYDPAAEKAPQTLSSLVANTMTSLMWQEKYRESVQLYNLHYSSKGRISDSALLQTYALALILSEDQPEAIRLKDFGRFGDGEANEVQIFLFLSENNYTGATKLVRDRAGGDGQNQGDYELWKQIQNECNQAGYLEIPKVRGWFEWALAEAR